jgi:hypothetical protein
VGARPPHRLHGVEFGAAASGEPDHYIGWSAPARRRNLRCIAYHTRFLILPWIEVPHLASHILEDGQAMYGHPVYFLETFVDPERFRGTCYRAAHWVLLSKTTGRVRFKRCWGIP